MKRLVKIFLGVMLALASVESLHAQHVVGVTGGYGAAYARFFPSYTDEALMNRALGSLTWRYYNDKLFWGGVGIDLEYMQRGFKFAPYGVGDTVDAELEYYTRNINSLIIPIVWQPHVYTPNKKARFFIEAAATFSYDLSSSYINEVALYDGEADWKGRYHYKLARDNRAGFGLAGGAGFSLLFDRWEAQFKGRYYYGYSDVVRNYNSYENNLNDGAENPFWGTPLRSQLDAIFISVGISYRLGKEKGFAVWKEERINTRELGTGFNYDGVDANQNKNSNNRNSMERNAPNRR